MMLPRLDDAEVLRQAFENSIQGILVTDERGRIVRANQAWLELHGYTLEEVVGKTTAVVKSEATTREMYEHMWAQIRDPARGSWRGEIVNRRKSGEELPLELIISPLRSSDGSLAGYVGLTVDLSERKQLEELKRLYDLVVRHDLKAPLAVVSGAVDLVLSGVLGSLAPEQQDVLQRAQRQSRRMAEMIATSLDLEKLRHRKLELDLQPTDLFSVARAALETFEAAAREKKIVLELRAGERPATAEDRLVRALDPLHLQRCCDNLVKNAVEAAPSGAPVNVSVSADGEAAKIEVHNPGDPIPPDVRATLFHPFGTYGKRGGTGLGLYGVKMLVEAMGGTVHCQTGSEGTRFTLRFPPAVVSPGGEAPPRRAA